MFISVLIYLLFLLEYLRSGNKSVSQFSLLLFSCLVCHCLAWFLLSSLFPVCVCICACMHTHVRAFGDFLGGFCFVYLIGFGREGAFPFFITTCQISA